MAFKRTHPGKKTALMLQVEARLGCTLEEDYREHYLEKGLGQKRLADRWGVKRNTVFESSERNRSRSWVEMLGLPVRRVEAELPPPPPPARPACEACAETSVPLERAHWVESSKGGRTSPDNIVLLCPNCHTKLDQLSDRVTTERVRAVLLHRAARKLLATGACTPEQFLEVCKQIIGGRPA
jgi:5-methylcytosine-specific restriction endonuclease McrA